MYVTAGISLKSIPGKYCVGAIVANIERTAVFQVDSPVLTVVDCTV